MPDRLRRIAGATQPSSPVGRALKVLLAALPLVIFAAAFAIMSSASGGAVLALGEKLSGLEGVSEEEIRKILDRADPELVRRIREQYGDLYAQALDCTNLPPAERRPGQNCIEGLLAAMAGEQRSAIPREAYWLLPIYRQAAKRYGLDWKLLAAINGARTRFGQIDCEGPAGVGFMRLHRSAWERYAVNAGDNKLERGVSGCYRAARPARIYERFRQPWKPGDKEDYASNRGADYFEAVDSIFTEARILARHGAYDKMQGGWRYSGSPSNMCTPPKEDGRVYFPPDFSALPGVAVLGYNKKLKLPRWIIVHSARWRKKHPPSTSPSGAMPTRLLLRYLETIWRAFGASPREARVNAKANLAQVMQESGGRSHAIQTVRDVNSGGNEAGGLLQFIPSTFNYWKVDGFNDRFAPLDNLLAGVNAQVNAEYINTVRSGRVKILSGNGGWGPGPGSNPYRTGGKKRNVSQIANGKSKRVGAFAYKGKAQTDPVSEAVAWDGERRMSACYVAVVWDWYQAIKRYPPRPGEQFSVRAPGGTRKIVGGGRLVKCPKQIPHDTSNGCYVDRRIVPDLLWIHKKFGIYISDGYSGPLPKGGRLRLPLDQRRAPVGPGRRHQPGAELQLGSHRQAGPLRRAATEQPAPALPLGRLQRRCQPRPGPPPAPLLGPLPHPALRAGRLGPGLRRQAKEQAEGHEERREAQGKKGRSQEQPQAEEQGVQGQAGQEAQAAPKLSEGSGPRRRAP